MDLLTVGEVARSVGLTVRTLHHYDEVGLLQPSRRSPSGYRLYGADDLERLLQVLSLRRLGLSLEEIRQSLEQPEQSLARVVDLHLRRLRNEVEAQQRLLRRLEALAARLARDEEISLQELTQTMEMMTMHERYMTPEQMAQLEERKAVVGQERIQEVEAEWPQLIARVREEMERGTDPAHPRVQELARRWRSLVEELTGGDPGIADSVRRMYAGESELRQRTGLDPEIMEYVARASSAGGDAS